jgi:hypothetical protein
MTTKRRKWILATASFGALALVVVLTPTGHTLAQAARNALLVEVVAPESPWRQGGSAVVIGTGSQIVVAGPSATPINLTSLSVAASPGDMGFLSLLAASVPTSAADCENADVYEIVYALNTVSTPVVVTFPTPFQVSPPSGEAVCLLATAGGTGGSIGGTMSINASGFYGS